jgi:menaquinol-cytochrome c reductase cytochrome b/c subunit
MADWPSRRKPKPAPSLVPAVEVLEPAVCWPRRQPAPASRNEKRRRFSIQGLVRGPFVKVGKLEEDTVFSWPNLLIAELFVLLLTIAGVLMAVSWFFNAPLEQPVNVMHPPNPAKAPWYFLGLQEQVSYSAFWGGIGIPGNRIAASSVLFLILDRGKAGRVGRWFARQRILANSIFLLTVCDCQRGLSSSSAHSSAARTGSSCRHSEESLVRTRVCAWR